MKTVQTLASEECSSLLANLAVYHGKGRPKIICCRNVCMTLLMLDAGLRVGELVQLLQGDLLYEGAPVQSLLIRVEIAKRKRERTVPLTPRVKQSIDRMRHDVWPQTVDWRSHYAFYPFVPHEPLTTRQVQRIILTAGKDALNRRVTPHMLRHTFATRVLAASNIRVAQQLLGHASIQTTQIYTHPNSLDHQNAIAVISGEQLDSNPQKT